MVIITLFGWSHRISQDGLVESSPEGFDDWQVRRPDEVGLEDIQAYVIRYHLKELSSDFPHGMRPKVVEPLVENSIPVRSGADVR